MAGEDLTDGGVDGADAPDSRPWAEADPWHQGRYDFEDQLDSRQLNELHRWQAAAREADLIEGLHQLRAAVPAIQPMGEVTDEQLLALTVDQRALLAEWQAHHAVWMSGRRGDHPDLPELATDADLAALEEAAAALRAVVHSAELAAAPSIEADRGAELLQQLAQIERHLARLTADLESSSAIRRALHLQLVYTSLRTESALANAVDAQGLQVALVTFASMLLDLASIADFLENLDEFRDDESLVKRLDAAYEFLKDFESYENSLAEQLDMTGSPLVNDLGGLVPTADEFWGNDPRTAIGTLKSHASDLAGILDELSEGKRPNPRTVGQLVARILKSIAEAQIAEREVVIELLQGNLVAEQTPMSPVWDDYGTMAERRHAAQAALDSVRSARAELGGLVTRFDPVAGSVPASGGAGSASIAAHTQELIEGTAAVAIGQAPVPDDCPECAGELRRFRDAQDLLERIERDAANTSLPERAVDEARADRNRRFDELQRCRRMLCPERTGGLPSPADYDLPAWSGIYTGHELVEAACDDCAHVAHEINGTRATIAAIRSEIERLEGRRRDADALRRRLAHLEAKQADVRRWRAEALADRERWTGTTVTDSITTDWLEEYQSVTAEIGAVARAIADAEAEMAQIPTLQERDRSLRQAVAQLLDLLERCEQLRCRPGGEFADAAALLAGDDDVRQLADDRAAADQKKANLVKIGIGVALLLGIGAILLVAFSGGGGDDGPTTEVPSPIDPGPSAPEPTELPPSPLAPSWSEPLAAIGASGEVPDAAAPVADPPGGISWSIEGTAGVERPSTSIDSSAGFVSLFDPDLIAQLFGNTSFPCGAVTDTYRVSCPLGAGELEAGEYLVVSVEHAGPVAEGGGRFTYAVAFDDDGDDGDNYQFVAPFDADFFRNTEHWYQLHIDEAGERTVWADGARDGALGHPRFSSAAVIEWGRFVVWVIPRSEVPGEPVGYRATAFHDEGEAGQVPNPATSGGDVTGLGVDEPLLLIALDPVELTVTDELPPDVDGTVDRLASDEEPDARIARILVEEFAARADAALAGDDPDAVDALLLPGLLDGPAAASCRESIDTTLALADGLAVTEVPAAPVVQGPSLAYQAVADLRYPTGTVSFGPVLTVGPLGRLYLVLPSCI